MEILEHQSEELIVHTVSRPPRQDLTLFSRVRTDSVVVSIKSRSVEAKLEKVDTGYWSSLGREKWSWIRRLDEDVEEDEDIIEENRSQDHEKRDAQPVPEAFYDKAETDEDDDDGLSDEEEDDLDHDFVSEDSVDTVNSSEEEYLSY